MEFPTVKSCFFLNVKIAGLLLGFVQLFIYGIAILFNLYAGAHLMLPIICEFAIRNMNRECS